MMTPNTSRRAKGSLGSYRHLAALTLAVLLLCTVLFNRVTASKPVPESPIETIAPTILIVNSYDRDNLWTQDQNEAFVNATRAKFPKATFYYEYLSSKKFSGEAYDQAVVALLQSKYRSLKIDYIYTTDDDATRLMTSHRSSIFTAQKIPIPIVFSGLNNRYDLPEHVFGVQEVSEVRGTIDLIRALQGTEARILTITDNTTTSQSIIDLNGLERLAQEDPAYFLFSSASIEAIKARLLVEDYDAVVFLLFNRDSMGQAYDYLSGFKLFSKHIKVPVYSTWDFYFDHGLVGGKLIDGHQQGTMASELLVSHAYQPNSAHPIMVAENHFTFDWNALKHHGISESQLPDDSRIIHRPENYFQKHREVLLTATAIIASLLVIIFLMARSLERHVNALKASQQHIMELQRTEALYRILITLSHELNTFIGNALMLTSHSADELNALKAALQSGQPSRSDVLEQLDAIAIAQQKICDNLQHSSNVLETLKTSHLDNPNRQFALVQIERTILGVLDRFKDQLLAHQAEVTVHCSGDVSFPMDAQDLATMVSELVHNALDHGFSEEIPQTPRLSIVVAVGKAELSMSIQDNGIGILAERLPYIFDPFATAALGKRKGLGLFHLRQLIQTIYDGRITCESLPGKGTSFHIDIKAKALDT